MEAGGINAVAKTPGVDWFADKRRWSKNLARAFHIGSETGIILRLCCGIVAGVGSGKWCKSACSISGVATDNNRRRWEPLLLLHGDGGHVEGGGRDVNRGRFVVDGARQVLVAAAG